jgi:hypothetical protein
MDHRDERVAEAALDLGVEATFPKLAEAAGVSVAEVKRLHGSKAFWKLLIQRAIVRKFTPQRALGLCRVMQHSLFLRMMDRQAKAPDKAIPDMLDDLKDAVKITHDMKKTERMIKEDEEEQEPTLNLREETDLMLESEGGRYFLEQEAKSNPEAAKILREQQISKRPTRGLLDVLKMKDGLRSKDPAEEPQKALGPGGGNGEDPDSE